MNISRIAQSLLTFYLGASFALSKIFSQQPYTCNPNTNIDNFWIWYMFIITLPTILGYLSGKKE